ncbi:MAG TPA: D-alanyl-D-alanine carboxypeptidase family protein [Rhizomicrobium sp.]|nr:D-alanyl-D-alanine carboxypeptidase family protein [Rhizomicrobium sp.]
MRRLIALLFAFAALAALPARAAVIATSAEHAMLMDGDTGQVLWAKDAYTPMPPASMSKLMTVELLFRELKDGRVKLTDTFPVSEAAWKTGGSTGFTRVGDKLTVDDLIQRIVVVSGNDACVVVAEALGGTTDNFVRMMNQRAKELGLTQSHFVNPNGLPDPPGQAMSAFDLAKLARHIINTYPEYYHYFGVRSYTTYDQGKAITQPNRDLVLEKFPGADGLKTGHTDAAGYGITASARRGNQRLILVINGLRYPDLARDSPQRQDWFAEQRRSDEAARILGIAFREFRHYRLFADGQVVGSAKVWRGTADTVPLKLAGPLALTMPVEAHDGLKMTLRYDGPVRAPVAANQQVGTLRITAPDFPAQDVPVYAANSVDSAGLFGRIFLGLRSLVSPDR